MTIIDSIRAWMRGPVEPEPDSRLTRAQALEIAQQAVAHHPIPREMADSYFADGQWQISTPTIGSQWLVVIDDATGDVLEVKQVGVR